MALFVLMISLLFADGSCMSLSEFVNATDEIDGNLCGDYARYIYVSSSFKLDSIHVYYTHQVRRADEQDESPNGHAYLIGYFIDTTRCKLGTNLPQRIQLSYEITPDKVMVDEANGVRNGYKISCTAVCEDEDRRPKSDNVGINWLLKARKSMMDQSMGIRRFLHIAKEFKTSCKWRYYGKGHTYRSWKAADYANCLNLAVEMYQYFTGGQGEVDYVAVEAKEFDACTHDIGDSELVKRVIG